MNLNIHSPLPNRKDWRIGCIGSGFIMNDCHLVAYEQSRISTQLQSHRAHNSTQQNAPSNIILQTVHESIEQLLDNESLEVLDLAIPPDNSIRHN